MFYWGLSKPKFMSKLNKSQGFKSHILKQYLHWNDVGLDVTKTQSAPGKQSFVCWNCDGDKDTAVPAGGCHQLSQLLNFLLQDARLTWQTVHSALQTNILPNVLVLS